MAAQRNDEYWAREIISGIANLLLDARIFNPHPRQFVLRVPVPDNGEGTAHCSSDRRWSNTSFVVCHGPGELARRSASAISSGVKTGSFGVISLLSHPAIEPLGR